MSSRERATSSATPERWRIGPADAPLIVQNADLLLPYLPYFLAGWDIAWQGEGGADADIEVSEEQNGAIRVVSHGAGGADFRFDDAYGAANGLAGALASLYVARRPGLVCLHAGAAVVGDGLVVVLGESFAGKSSVALHLAALGNRFFSDDRVAVSLATPVQGVCLGLMPKVRLPLPDESGDAFREFVGGYTALESDGTAILKLWDGEAAAFEETAPLKALVFLDRGDNGPVDLVPVSRTELVKSMVSTAFAPHLDSRDLLSGLGGLASTIDSFRLRFSNSREAAAFLSRHFR